MLRLGMRDPLLSCVPVRQGELAVKLPGEWLRQLRQCTWCPRKTGTASSGVLEAYPTPGGQKGISFPAC